MKRTVKTGRLFFCPQCFYYWWRDKDGPILRSMMRPEWGKSSTRTCRDCAK